MFWREYLNCGIYSSSNEINNRVVGSCGESFGTALEGVYLSEGRFEITGVIPKILASKL